MTDPTPAFLPGRCGGASRLAHAAALPLLALTTACPLLALAAATLLAASPSPAEGQGPPSTAGVVVGYSATEQLWEPEAEVERVGGLVVGAYLNAATPREWLTVLAEGTYTQRGGDVIAGGTGGVEGAVRSDYLTASVRPQIRAGAGRLRLHAAAGPAVDILVRSRLAPGFESVLANEGSMVFGLMAGAGVDVGVGGGRVVGVEGRIFEGLSEAYSGDFVSLRNRSWQVVVRFGISLDR